MSGTPTSQVGPVLIGTVINWFLLGTLLVQLYIYVNNQKAKRDGFWLRIIVHTIVVVNIFETVLCTHFLWALAVSHWGDKGLFESRSLPWTGEAIGPVTGIVAILAQCTYSWRIWKITQSYAFRAVACITIALSLMQFGAFVAAFAWALIGNAGNTVEPIIIELAGGFATDTLIAASMFVLLNHARAQSVWVNPRSLYDRLIIITVSTGFITAATAGVALGLFVHDPISNTWTIPALFISKLYGNSFLAALNDRFFRPEERDHCLGPDQNLQGTLSSVGVTTIQFSRGNRREEDTTIDVRVHGCERQVNCDRSSTLLVSLESRSRDLVKKGPVEHCDESTLASRDGKVDALGHETV